MSRRERRVTIYGLGFLVGCIACWIFLLLAMEPQQWLASGVMILLPASFAALLAYRAPRHGIHWGVAVSLPLLLVWTPAILANAPANAWRSIPLLLSLGLACLAALAASRRRIIRF